MKHTIVKTIAVLSLILALLVSGRTLSFADEQADPKGDAVQTTESGEMRPEEAEASEETTAPEETEPEKEEITEKDGSPKDDETEIPEEPVLETVSDFDPEEQLQAYLDRNLLGITEQPEKKRGGYNGSRLTGFNQLVYTAAKEHLEKIAAGEETSTALTLTFPVPDEYRSARWTAEDLGIDSLVITEGGVKKVSPEVAAAMCDVTGYDRTKIVYALLRDCPYEMFWFGLSYACGSPWGVYGSESAGYLVRIKDTVTLNFVVAEDFADPDAAADSGGHRYAVDPQVIGAVNGAVAHAKEIAANAPSGSASDEDILRYYFTEVRLASEYNAAAAAQTGAYGNPWQIIYLFDGIRRPGWYARAMRRAFSSSVT